MISRLKLYSTDSNEILDFLQAYYGEEPNLTGALYWEQLFLNPLEMAGLIAAFVDNKDHYPNTNLWISIDSGVFINVKEDNYNLFIQYLYERYPY